MNNSLMKRYLLGRVHGTPVYGDLCPECRLVVVGPRELEELPHTVGEDIIPDGGRVILVSHAHYHAYAMRRRKRQVKDAIDKTQDAGLVEKIGKLLGV